MSFSGCLVVEQDDQWLITVGELSDVLPIDASAEELATCAGVMTGQASIKNANCILAPSSQSCFFRALRPGTDFDVRDRSALIYELEDHIPIDAESMVADFVVVPSTEQAKTIASVAIEVHRWRRIADAFEAAEIPVHSITPAACLAARSLARDWNLPDTIELVLVDGEHCDLMKIQAETILAWKRMRLDPVLLQRHAALDSISEDRTVVVGATPTQLDFLKTWKPSVEVIDESYSNTIQMGASLAISKHSDRWFNLRRDELSPSDPMYAIRTPLRLATVAAIAFFLVVAVGGWWRTQRIEQEISQLHQSQRQIFQDAFPDVRVPGALLRRVRSEHTRARSLRGGGTSKMDIPHSAPDILRDLVAALPSDVRVHFKVIAITNGEVTLDFQVRDTVDAGALAESLGAAGFEVEPPQTTQKDAKTYDSVLKAKWTSREASDSLGESASLPSVRSGGTG
jgi:type II secretory pathway component PulL